MLAKQQNNVNVALPTIDHRKLLTKSKNQFQISKQILPTSVTTKTTGWPNYNGSSVYCSLHAWLLSFFLDQTKLRGARLSR